MKLIAMGLLLTACSAGVEADDTIVDDPTTTTSSTTTTSVTTTTSSTTTTSTTSATLRQPSMIEPSVIGVWPYRTAQEVLAAAVDGIEQDPVVVVKRFVEDHIGWTVGAVTTSFEGPTLVGYELDSSGGTISVLARVVATTPSRDDVWAIDFASSLDPLDPEWGPGTDIAESEEGWSALIGGTPIQQLTSQPGVTGPYAQLHYGDWESERTLIGPNGASIAIPITPDNPGVLSIWYLAADESVVGFSLYALPAGSFVAG